MSIGILYERSETDEMGIKLRAAEVGVDLVFLPFHKVSIVLDEDGYRFSSRGKDYSRILSDINVVLNRAQSKSRRLFAGNILESFGKIVINPSSVEYICSSKLCTLLHLWHQGIKTPRTVYVPCNPRETRVGGGVISNYEGIADLLQHAGFGRVTAGLSQGTPHHSLRSPGRPGARGRKLHDASKTTSHQHASGHGLVTGLRCSSPWGGV